MAGLLNPTSSLQAPPALGPSAGANTLGTRLGNLLSANRARSSQRTMGFQGGLTGLFGGLAQMGGPPGPMTAPSKAAPIGVARTSTAAMGAPGPALLARTALRGLPPPHARIALGMPSLPGLPGTRLTLRQLIGKGGLLSG